MPYRFLDRQVFPPHESEATTEISDAGVLSRRGWGTAWSFSAVGECPGSGEREGGLVPRNPLALGPGNRPVLPVNPAASVRGPKHTVGRGQTPALLLVYFCRTQAGTFNRALKGQRCTPPTVPPRQTEGGLTLDQSSSRIRSSINCSCQRTLAEFSGKSWGSTTLWWGHR